MNKEHEITGIMPGTSLDFTESVAKSQEIISENLETILESNEYDTDTKNYWIQYAMEKTLDSADRRKLDDSDFGIPETRSFPINDRVHVRAAIQRFNSVDPKYEKTLAKNILQKMKHFHMLGKVEVSKGNRFASYINTAYREFASDFDIHPFPKELTTEFVVGAMLPMMGSTSGWGTELSNADITDVVGKDEQEASKYATGYDLTELYNDAIKNTPYTGMSFDDGLVTKESALHILPERNITFDKEVEKLVKNLKEFVDNPKNDFLEDILKKSVNLRKTIYNVKLMDQKGDKSNKIINKIKSSGYTPIDDQGIKVIYEKEVQNLLITVIYDTVGDKVKISYDEKKEGVNHFNESTMVTEAPLVAKKPTSEEVSKAVAELKKVLAKHPEEAKKITFISPKGSPDSPDDVMIASYNMKEIPKLMDILNEVNLDNGAYTIFQKTPDDKEAFVCTNAYESTMTESSHNIDSDIQAYVDELNKRGYTVKYSCSGHVKARVKNDGFRNGILNGKLYTTARIVFDKDYKIGAPDKWIFKPYPDGKCAVIPDPKTYSYSQGTPDESFEKWKEEYMGQLRSWISKLGNKPGPEEDKSKKE